MEKVVKYYVFLVLFTFIVSCDGIENIVQPSSSVSMEKMNSVIKETYPEAKEVTINLLEKDMLFKADFKIDKDIYSSVLNENGKMIETLKSLNGIEILPDKALEYVKNKFVNYNAKNSFAKISGKSLEGYKIILSQNSQNQILMFDNEGNTLIEITNFLTPSNTNVAGINTPTIAYSTSTDPINFIVVDFKTLPQNIQDYFKDGSKGEVISAAIYLNTKDKGYVVVTKKSDKKIQHLFDKNGEFVSTIEPNSGINVLPTPSKEKPVTDIVGENFGKENIPAKILEFLNKNFAGWTFQKGYLKRVKGGDILNYDIVISFGKDQTYILSFDKNQDIIKKELISGGSAVVNSEGISENMLIQNVPSKLKDAITLQFGTFTYMKGLIQKNKEGVIISYYVVIESGNDKKMYYLTYDPNFKLIKKEVSEQPTTPPVVKVKTTELLTITTLPTKIKEFLNKNHSIWNLEKGLLEKDEKGNIINYIVAITADGKLIYYTFDKNMDIIPKNTSGGIPETTTSIAIVESKLPQEIRAILDVKFKGWVFGSALGFYNSKKEIESYKVIIGVGSIKYAVLFDKAFKFLSFSKLG